VSGARPRARRRASPPLEDIARRFPELEVQGFIGEGGMGAVYRARQTRIDRPVALKVLALDPGDDPTFAERFRREAMVLARLDHKNVVKLYDFGDRDGLYYLILELVDGSNLRTLMKQGLLAPEQALAIVPQICEALQFAHDAGVVHRDIKPENVLLDAKGRVKIADFGLAKLIDPERSLLTGTHQAMGTPHYMAPEQWERPLEVDHRADIYSLGVVFYELLTGELPLGRFPLPSQKVQIDVRLDEVVLRTLEKEPDRRYQHASEVKTDVERIGQSASTPQVTQEQRAPQPASRSSFFWYFIVPTLTLAVIAGAVTFLTWEEAGRQVGEQGFETQVSKSAVLVVNIAIVAVVVLAFLWFWRRHPRPVTDSPLLIPAPPAPFLRGVVAPCAVLGTIAVLIATGISRFYRGPVKYRDDLTAAAIVVGFYGTLILFAVLALRWFARRRQQSVLRTLANAASFLGLNSLTNWASFLCTIGAANVWLPWFTESKSGQWYSLRSFATAMDWWQLLLAVCLVFLIAGFLLFVLGSGKKLRPLRILVMLAAALFTLVLALLFILDLPRSILGSITPPAFISLGLSTALFLMGAIELRSWLASTNRLP
jgi:predicted Ser/Thr protein kinase